MKDKKLSKYSTYQYITITPSSLYDQSLFDYYNSELDTFSAYLSNGSKRRYKTHPLYNSDYMIFKEIVKVNGVYLPHLHIITASKEPIELEHPMFSINSKDIDFTLNTKYDQYNDYRNPIITTLKSIFIYSTKYDKDRGNFEATHRISKNKSDIKVSSIFRDQSPKAHNLFPIHILLRQEAREARSQALREHRAYKHLQKISNGIKTHKHALKTRRKLDRIEKTLKRKISAENRKLKRAKRPRDKTKSRTHNQKQHLT